MAAKPSDRDALVALLRSKGATADEIAAALGAPPAARRNKYGAIRTEYAGWTYDSKGEAEYAAHLDAMVSAGDVAWWLPQVPFFLGCRENKYVADFLVAEPQGDGVAVHAVDFKGVETAKFRKDVKLWRRYGKLPLRVVSRSGVKVINPEP